MADDELDPGASTQMFQAFMDRAEPETSGSSNRGIVLGIVLAALVILLAFAWFLFGG